MFDSASRPLRKWVDEVLSASVYQTVQTIFVDQSTRYHYQRVSIYHMSMCNPNSRRGGTDDAPTMKADGLESDQSLRSFDTDDIELVMQRPRRLFHFSCKSISEGNRTNKKNRVTDDPDRYIILRKSDPGLTLMATPQISNPETGNHPIPNGIKMRRNLNPLSHMRLSPATFQYPEEQLHKNKNSKEAKVPTAAVEKTKPFSTTWGTNCEYIVPGGRMQ